MKPWLRLRMLRPWLDLVSFEGKGSRFAAKPGIDTASIAKLGTSFTPTPDRSVMGSTMAAFWANVVLIRLVRRIPVVCVCVDELLRSQPITLLQIQATGVAQRLEGCWISPPEGCRGGFTVRTALYVGIGIDTARRSMWIGLYYDRCCILVHRRRRR